MLVKAGNLLFHYRNFIFPVLYLLLFIPSPELMNDEKLIISVGLFFIVAGIAVRSFTIGFEYIVRGGHNRQIYADELVTKGIYKVCRNPMYLGNLLIIAGFGIYANSLIFMLVVFPLFLFIYLAIIKAEEAFLQKKFGAQFLAYVKSTNAIIPGLSKLSSAIQNYRYNWQKVIFKEYNSTFLHISGILALSLKFQRINLLWFLIIFGVTLIIYLIIKFLKYHNPISLKKIDSNEKYLL